MKDKDLYFAIKDKIKNARVDEIWDYGPCPETDHLRFVFVTSYRYFNPVVVSSRIYNPDTWKDPQHRGFNVASVTASKEYVAGIVPKHWPAEPEIKYTKARFDRLFSLD